MFKEYYGFTKNPFDKQAISVKDAFDVFINQNV